MLLLGPLGFLTPWILIGLAALPVLWLILRAMPPTPKLVRFPGTRLLLGLRDPHPVARHTPWWLLLLRVLAIGALILGAAGPVWKPSPEGAGQGPLLIVMDAGWAAAPDWPQRQARVLRALSRAEAEGQPAAMLIADGRAEGALPFQPAGELAGPLRALRPAAWETRYPRTPRRRWRRRLRACRFCGLAMVLTIPIRPNGWRPLLRGAMSPWFRPRVRAARLNWCRAISLPCGCVLPQAGRMRRTCWRSALIPRARRVNWPA
ncbi:BatA domain-containing protein [Paracoccus kondratievae]